MQEKKMGAPLRFPLSTGDPVRDRIIILRRRLGLSQAALASRLGITESAARHWEAGLTKPSGPALLLLEQLEGGLDNVVQSPDGKRRSVGERLKRARSTASKREIALEWARNWKYGQSCIIERIKRAAETRARDFLFRALRELEASSEKQLGVLPRVIELLLEGVEEDPP